MDAVFEEQGYVVERPWELQDSAVGFGDEVPGMAIGELCLRLQGLTRPFHANVIHSRSGQQPFKDYMICFQCDLYGED